MTNIHKVSDMVCSGTSLSTNTLSTVYHGGRYSTTVTTISIRSAAIDLNDGDIDSDLELCEFVDRLLFMMCRGASCIIAVVSAYSWMYCVH